MLTVSVLKVAAGTSLAGAVRPVEGPQREAAFVVHAGFDLDVVGVCGWRCEVDEASGEDADLGGAFDVGGGVAAPPPAGGPPIAPGDGLAPASDTFVDAAQLGPAGRTRCTLPPTGSPGCRAGSAPGLARP